jgi:hypothetical protein
MCFGGAVRQIAAVAEAMVNSHFETMPCRPMEKETTMSRSMDEENAVFFGDIKIENLVTVPEDAGELVTTQRRMPPVY